MRPLVLLAIASLLSQCDPAEQTRKKEESKSAGFFATEWETEAEFVVTDILRDVAEMAAYAEAPYKVPEVNVAVSYLDTNADSPVFQTSVSTVKGDITAELALSRRIWSPRLYSGLAKNVTDALHLKPTDEGTLTEQQSADFARGLTDFTPEAIQQANRLVSDQLRKNFRNPQIHARAAVVLATLALRDQAGIFTEKRPALNRATAHLVFAEALDPRSVNDPTFRLADAMIATASGSQASAIKLIETLPPEFEPWPGALTTMVTGDWRILEPIADRSRLESIAYFEALVRSIEPGIAIEEMPKDELDDGPEWARILLATSLERDVADPLISASSSQEMAEIKRIYQELAGETLDAENLRAFLNERPESAIGAVDGKPQPEVVSKGHWAHYLQRHLMHANAETYRHLSTSQDTLENALAFRETALRAADGLRYEPFLRRVMTTDEEDYLEAMDDLYNAIKVEPEVMPAGAWNLLSTPPHFRDQPYIPAGNHSHVNEWHSVNPLPGTAYDIKARLQHSNLKSRADLANKASTLHDIAPYDLDLLQLAEKTNYDETPSYEASADLYAPVVPFNPEIRRRVAGRTTDTEAWFELMEEAAEVFPRSHYELGERLITLGENQKAAEHLSIAMETWPDASLAADHSIWLAHYYLDQQDIEQARTIASRAAETRSEPGLLAAATLAERLADYAEAERIYKEIRSRHGNAGPLRAFYYRHRERGADTPRLAAGLYEKVRDTFRDGLEKVTIEELGPEPPAGSIEVAGTNWFTQQVGLQKGARIVALDGFRVKNIDQYQFVRDLSWSPQLSLIVWQNGGYQELTATLWDRLFGIPLEER